MRNLIFYLFGGLNGVGFYNQIFSLELAIYLSNISKRYLILIIDKPLAIMGKNDWSVGTIIDYINDVSHLLPYGYEIRKESKEINYNSKTIKLPKKISSCYAIDEKIKSDNKVINEFAHGRIDVSDIINVIYDEHEYVTFTDSNASRFFYNFYTTKENYLLMNHIAYSLSLLPEYLEKKYKIIKAKINYNYIAIHLRFGDKHICEDKKNSKNNEIFNNINNWIQNHNYKFPILIMTDFKENPFFIKLQKKHIIQFTDEVISTSRENLNSIESFLLEKKICENSEHFIGTQTSTVSCHIQYKRYINKKSYTYYVNGTGNNFDKSTLSYNENPNNKYKWAAYNYPKGNALSWQLFFEDNIYIH